jgi:hypothetical protein
MMRWRQVQGDTMSDEEIADNDPADWLSAELTKELGTRRPATWTRTGRGEMAAPLGARLLSPVTG